MARREEEPGFASRLLHIPAILVASRFFLGPLLVAVSILGAPGWIITVLLVAMLSDIFDGVIARRLGIATEGLRVLDSRADAWFFLCVGLAAWLPVPKIVLAYATPIVAEVVIQAATYAYDLIRYGRLTSLHAYSAKVWGFSLYVAAASLLAFHNGAFIWIAFAFGIVSVFDAMIIKLILPGWRHDILSCVHAWRLRQTEQSG
jgi:phosphatidylglycerophosphate synthase